LTIYEARLPFSALPGINAQNLAARDGAVRFGWILHNDEGAPLDFGRAAGNFPWWENTATFLPEGTLSSALRLTLGFTNAEAGAITEIPRPRPQSGVPARATLPTPVAPPVIVPSVIAPSVIAPAPPLADPPLAAPLSPAPPREITP